METEWARGVSQDLGKPEIWMVANELQPSEVLRTLLRRERVSFSSSCYPDWTVQSVTWRIEVVQEIRKIVDKFIKGRKKAILEVLKLLEKDFLSRDLPLANTGIMILRGWWLRETVEGRHVCLNATYRFVPLEEACAPDQVIEVAHAG